MSLKNSKSVGKKKILLRLICTNLHLFQLQQKRTIINLVVLFLFDYVVFIPAEKPDDVTEDGSDIINGIKFLRMESNTAVFAVNSCNYRFVSRLNK